VDELAAVHSRRYVEHLEQIVKEIQGTAKIDVAPTYATHSTYDDGLAVSGTSRKACSLQSLLPHMERHAPTEIATPSIAMANRRFSNLL
jgi:hypothetical protein